jgi:hypothetical protein
VSSTTSVHAPSIPKALRDGTRERSPDIDSNTTAYENQVKDVQSALETYGTEHVLGVSMKLGSFSVGHSGPEDWQECSAPDRLYSPSLSLPLSATR